MVRPPISTDWPKSFAPASAPLTTSRFTASAKRPMNRVETAKYATSVQRAAASRKTSSQLARMAFMTRPCWLLGEHRAAHPNPVDQRVDLLQIFRRDDEVTIDALDRGAGFGKGGQEPVVERIDHHAVTGDLAGQTLDRALSRDAASREHGDPVAGALDLREQMGIQENRRAAPGLFPQEVPNFPAPYRIDSVGRLV